MANLESLQLFSPQKGIENLRQLYTRNDYEKANHIQSIKSLNEILDSPAFMNEKAIYVICDLDGVVINSFPFPQNDKNFSSFRALSEICRKAESFVLWSNRKPVADESRIGRLTQGNLAISRTPFITERSIKRASRKKGLLRGLHKQKLEFGWEKMWGNGRFATYAEKALAKDGILIVIGSSFFDRRSVKQFLDQANPDTLDRFYYYDTGRILY